jgi:hypothetical protein
VALGNQPLAQVRSNKTGAAGDQYAHSNSSGKSATEAQRHRETRNVK